MKIPLKTERDSLPTQKFTLPLVSSYGSAQTLPMTTEQLEAAARREQQGERFGFGRGQK